MLRTIVFLLAALLAACTSQGTSSGAASDASAAASGGASDAGAAQPVGEASPACTEAFAPIAELELSAASDLGDLDEVTATVESCESVADWTAGASAAIGTDVRAGTADLLLGLRCSDPGLSSTAICQEVTSN
jgi:hypothetical protein